MLAELTSDRLELEQYTDFALSRAFRRSLLCHADVELRAEPTPEDVVELYFVRLRQDAATDNDPLAVDVLGILTEAAPRAVHFAELLDAVGACSASSSSDELAACVLDLVIAGEVRAAAWAPSFASAPSARPLASPVTRDQLRRSTLAASLRHTEVQLDGLPRALLLLLDGQHARTELVDELVQMIDDGRMKISTRQDLTAEQLRERLADIVDATLQQLAAASVLVDESAPAEQ